jgi:hypothetical protein
MFKQQCLLSDPIAVHARRALRRCLFSETQTDNVLGEVTLRRQRNPKYQRGTSAHCYTD